MLKTRFGKKKSDHKNSDRIVDKGLKAQIEKRSLYTYELHYPEHQLIYNYTKTTIKPRAVPSINLPVKSISSTVAAER